ncbi:hypothetical protein V4Z64_006412 [Pseudomonas aeruginosa]|uniref:hypothetical protein n=1 Tax=Pseudomonas aeruginosa TaxID=287 RepID=UPI000F538B14|nr:hypothetical protein [Pseudomonas aeruginosa]MBA5107664.1 hypothetical protein [Pseudomonas aeruginosa]MBD1300103.1 hypothetical protein [Pseudomonas aeruginosa]MBD1340668.1 hypothetical protein [Pseudomonas aeruginosa]MCO2528442.1 hypothetical protein [Pseudomonas aeruginosa]MCO2541416.1 hypothetical protein [Pseudomonas aeruginosa]
MKRMTSELAASSPIKVCLAEVLKAARVAPAIYFAPILGAISGVARQWNKLQHQAVGKQKLA